MKLMLHLKPKFWEHAEVSEQPHKYIFNFRKMWELTVLLTLAVTLAPLLTITIIDYRMSQKAIESEILLQTERLVSNTRRTVTYFLTEHKAALGFAVLNDSYESLMLPGRLENVLENLKTSFGGLVDLGLINDKGVQLTYVGPYELTGKNYSSADWFKNIRSGGFNISDVFLGFRHVPHMVIAVKHDLPDGSFYVLRATLDTARFNDLLSGLEVSGKGDAFIINREGILQTPSRYQGKVLDRFTLEIPKYSEKTQVLITKPPQNLPLISPMDATQPFDSEEKNKVKAAKYFNESSLVIGYAYIPESPFILMIVKNKEILFKSWHNSMIQLVSFLIISVVAIIIVVLGGITFLVNQIYLADHRRLMAMHKVEYANKMASLGQLSAGVAHEINNPLAIINEKAGLIKDIFSFNEEYSKNLKLIGLVDSIISSVERCSGITRRLLNFARHSDMKMVPIRLKTVIEDVLSFVRKEAEYRGIEVGLIVAENIPVFESDQGKLQEIFLNLITNAFAAMNDNGSLNITATLDKKNYTAIHFSDDGHGIADEDLERIFEPFFSTRIGKGGTGLGLSITYGLVQELGGRIEVVSQVGVGTTFTVILPLKPPEFRKSPGDSRLNTEKKDGNSFEYPSDFGI